jgi:hypothetical protein
MPKDGTGTGRGRDQSQQHRHRRDLASAVGTDEPREQPPRMLRLTASTAVTDPKRLVNPSTATTAVPMPGLPSASGLATAPATRPATRRVVRPVSTHGGDAHRERMASGRQVGPVRGQLRRLRPGPRRAPEAITVAGTDRTIFSTVTASGALTGRARRPRWSACRVCVDPKAAACGYSVSIRGPIARGCGFWLAASCRRRRCPTGSGSTKRCGCSVTGTDTRPTSCWTRGSWPGCGGRASLRCRVVSVSGCSSPWPCSTSPGWCSSTSSLRECSVAEGPHVLDHRDDRARVRGRRSPRSLRPPR